MSPQQKWKSSKHPLFRGDAKSGVRLPVPQADSSIIRHILYLEGMGRETPYLSATEQQDVAKRFAVGGAIWQTYVKKIKDNGVKHISNSELLKLMKKNGMGKAKWDDAFEVMQARRYAEQWGEHLLDFSEIEKPEDIISILFEKI